MGSGRRDCWLGGRLDLERPLEKAQVGGGEEIVSAEDLVRIGAGCAGMVKLLRETSSRTHTPVRLGPCLAWAAR